MKLNIVKPSLAVAALAGAAWLASAAGDPQTTNAPASPAAEYTFREPPLNSFGVKSLAELRGKPVIIDFWGKNCPPCVGSAVPASVKLQEEFGEDVQVIFVESQNTPKDTVEAFAWKKKWMGNGAMWTAERPVSMVGDGLPEAVVLGIDGSILMQGNPLDLGKKIDEAVVAEIKKAKQAPKGTPKALDKAWQLYNKGEIAAAMAECAKVGGADADKAKSDFESRTTARIARVKWMIENGFMTAAEKALVSLEKAVKGDAELAGKVAEQRTRFGIAELADEREADKAYAFFVSKVAKDKPFEPANVTQAETLANRFKGTKTAQRLERFVALSKIKIEQ